MQKITILLAALGAMFSCNKTQDNNTKDNPYKSLDLTTKSAEFVQKGGAFSFDYIDRINAEAPGDYIISPLSMQFLLGMILDGAQGQTADEIAQVLGYGAGEVQAVNEFCLSMLQQLPTLDKMTTLSIANAIFVDDGWPLKDAYKSAVGQYFQAQVSNLDFMDEASSLRAINGWCEKHTNGLIPKILDEVNPEMLAYLLNAMYFKSQWKEKFQKSSTANETFTDESGAKVKVPMMKQNKSHGYAENGIGAFAMYVFLPRGKYNLADVTASLKKSDWNEVRNNLRSYSVDLWFPKFETKFQIQLKEILSAMGMP